MTDASPSTYCRPTEQWLDAILNSILLASDPFSQEAAVDYWTMSAAGHEAVMQQVRTCSAPSVRRALDRLLTDPGDPLFVADLAASIQEDARRSDTWRQIATAALDADALGRLSLHLGSDARLVEPVEVRASALASWQIGPSNDVRDDAPIVVVIPFRDRAPDEGRLRNLLAVLHALRDQDADRSLYRLVVVEQDSYPRWKSLIEPLVEEYLHLAWDGHFNKAWAVNAGVQHFGGQAEIVCVLDADVLPDRGFVTRNAERFRARGAQAHLPFRDALCLDDASSHRAIADRVLEGAPHAPLEHLRGVFLRRPPGHCVWVRRSLFERVGGFDERFEGWGGEDLDLVFRLDVVGAVDRYEDILLHLFHPRPPTHENGRRFYAGRQLLTWRPEGPTGQLDGPVKSLDDDLAGLIERNDGLENVR